eukprot:SAG11_NODE_3300_length_2539_cov_0.963934_1_plen_99_part_00
MRPRAHGCGRVPLQRDFENETVKTGLLTMRPATDPLSDLVRSRLLGIERCVLPPHRLTTVESFSMQDLRLGKVGGEEEAAVVAVAEAPSAMSEQEPEP